MRLGARYAPASSVVRVRATPLAVSVIVKGTPGIKPPVPSFTVPEMRPLAVCPNMEEQNNNTPNTTNKTIRALVMEHLHLSKSAEAGKKCKCLSENFEDTVCEKLPLRQGTESTHLICNPEG